MFDLWSNFYDAPLIQRLTYRPEHDAIVRALEGIESKRRVLDMGCGTGILSARVQREFKETRVVGCDFSSGMLHQASRGRRGPRWVRGDALQLPFADGSLDVIVSTEAFHWFPDQRKALIEFFRVLTPGGRLLVSLINPPLEVMSRLTRATSKLVGQPLYWPTRSRMRRQVEAAGFRDVSQRQIFRIPAGVLMPSVLTSGVRPD